MASTKLYGQDRANAWESQQQRLSGNANSLICVISSTPLAPLTQQALEKSFQALGHGPNPCTYLTLQDQSSDSLGEKELFSLVEALDPIILVIADAAAIEACQKAWRSQVPPHAQFKLFGRKARAFANLDAWVADEKGKQRVWSLLKSL